MNETDTNAPAPRRPLVAFFALAFVLSWACWLPQAISGQGMAWLEVLGRFGPAIAAIILASLAGRQAVAALLAPMLTWRVGWIWYAVALGGTAVAILLAIGIDVLLGGAVPAFPEPARWALAPLVFGYVLVFSVLGEEIGWRGYALPRLLGLLAPIPASVALGVLWWAWHLPLFGMPGSFHAQLPPGLLLVQILGVSILYTWLYLNTRGSLLIAHLFHAAFNASVGLLPILPSAHGGSLRPLWIAVGLLWIAAACAALSLPRTRNGAPRRPPEGE